MSFYESWYEEKRSAYLYGILAENETNIVHKKLFKNLKKAAENQAYIWEKKLKASGNSFKTFKPDLRSRIVGQLVKIFGTENLHYILSAMKIRGMSIYNYYHNEQRHTSFSSANNLRAAVFGINDGLISNMSLLLGVIGANANQHFIILTGIAGLLAGACSMGAGEYISVQSQREVFEYQIAIEEEELKEYPEEEMEELSLIYQARGVPSKDAKKIAELMISNPKTGLNTLAREELGLNPDDLVSPIGAMLSSFFSFTIGAAIPLLPFFFGSELAYVLISIGVTAISLFIIGAILSLYSNRSPVLLGIRMLIVGTIAGVSTFLIGKLLGIKI